MSFTVRKDEASGVVVVGVDGQLIVGNRHDLKKKVREVGGDLRLAGLNEDLRSLFELTKLDTLFTLVDSVEEAVAAF